MYISWPAVASGKLPALRQKNPGEIPGDRSRFADTGHYFGGKRISEIRMVWYGCNRYGIFFDESCLYAVFPDCSRGGFLMMIRLLGGCNQK